MDAVGAGPGLKWRKSTDFFAKLPPNAEPHNHARISVVMTAIAWLSRTLLPSTSCRVRNDSPIHNYGSHIS